MKWILTYCWFDLGQKEGPAGAGCRAYLTRMLNVTKWSFYISWEDCIIFFVYTENTERQFLKQSFVVTFNDTWEAQPREFSPLWFIVQDSTESTRLLSGQGPADLLQSRVRPFRQVPNVQIQILPSNTDTTIINYWYYHHFLSTQWLKVTPIFASITDNRFRLTAWHSVGWVPWDRLRFHEETGQCVQLCVPRVVRSHCCLAHQGGESCFTGNSRSL